MCASLLFGNVRERERKEKKTTRESREERKREERKQGAKEEEEGQGGGKVFSPSINKFHCIAEGRKIY